jgi:hypothetical protein
MPFRYVSIALKIPDNEALTALAALRRLGVSVDAVERADIYRVDGALDEGRFNPNKHIARDLEGERPRAGEMWIEELAGDGAHRVAWRLFADDRPCERDVVAQAARALLCNAAVERAMFSE